VTVISSIETILKTEGPCLSSRLCARLGQNGLSNTAARQRVARANGAVKRLQGLVFPRGTRFLYHESTFNSDLYWQALVRDIGEASPAYAAAVAALRARGGIVPRAWWDIVSGSPLRQKGQIASETVLERLLRVRLVELVDLAGIGPCVALAGNGCFGRLHDEALKARLVTEKILLLAVRDWARKLGAASYDKIALRDDSGGPPRVGTFAWDLTGPSYLRPMIRRGSDGKPKPGFLACDVLIGDGVDDGAIAAFVRKCQIMAGLKRMPALFPILIADRFSREAFNRGRSHGVMMATPGTLFGREVAAGLATLLQTLTKAAAVAVRRPELIGELFDKLGRIEGAAANLRGALFEMVVGHCVVQIDCGTIDIGKKIADPQSGQRAEIDVFRVKGHLEVWSYECKAHQPSEIVGRTAIEEWLTRKVPLIHRVLRQENRFPDSTFHFEFWTCGSFSPEAEALLKETAAQTKRYVIGWKDGAAVRDYAAKLRPKAVAEMLDQHFFAHPLTLIDRRNEPGSPVIGDIDFGDLIDGGNKEPDNLEAILS
jgi:hypothetical protein